MANVGDPTFDVLYTVEGEAKDSFNYVISNGVQLYVGQIVTTLAGYANKWVANSVAGSFPVGVALEGGTPGSDPNMDNMINANGLQPNAIAPGSTGGSAGTAPQVVVERGRVTYQQLTLQIQGTLAGTIADVGTKLYAATSNLQDLTPTQPGTDGAFGKIAAYRGAGAAGYAIYDVTAFPFATR